MKNIDLFEYSDYKKYLTDILELRGQSEKGQRTKLAEHISCQSAYLSSILNGNANLSPEQAQSTAAFLNHTATEARFFLNLVLLERAGTKNLKSYYHQELDKIKKERSQLKNRISTGRELSEKQQIRYYSSWYYAAIHILVSIKKFSTIKDIASALNLSPNKVSEVLEFLTEIGVLKKKANHYLQGEVNLFLDKNSPFINKHHTNWRIKAVQSFDSPAESDFHYSGVITCSPKSREKIRELLLKAVESIRAEVRATESEEHLQVYTLDFFSLIDEK